MADRRITLGHGSGGLLTHELIRDVFAAELKNPFLDPLGDAALLPRPDERLAVTTDAFVVSPLSYNGGDIGSLAINGTVNDLAVSGAHPRYLTLSAILEEGLELELLRRIVGSAAAAARAAGVLVVTGDTKVVERGKGDQLFLITTGVGVLRPGYPPQGSTLAPGDTLLVSGPVGDHGAVILASRSGVRLETTLHSDCAPVTPLVDALFDAGVVPKFLRDPTRGGLCGVLCDLAESGIGVEVREGDIPVRPETDTICEIVGVDWLHLACEGRVVAVVAAEDGPTALAAWRGLANGRDAAPIGALTDRHTGKVVLETRYGGARALFRPTAELLPRIC